MTLESLRNATYTREIRNPALVAGMELLCGTENKGTGVRVAQKAMQQAGLQKPIFTQDEITNTFYVTLKSEIGRFSTETTSVFS